MTEEKKGKIRNVTAATIIVCAVLMFGYLIYGIVTKNLETKILNGLAFFLIGITIMLGDIVEPYLTGVFAEMDDYRKKAYGTYLLWELLSMAGLLCFVLNFGKDEMEMFPLIAIGVYFIGSKKKRAYESVYRGSVSKEDVEAAKIAAEEE